MRPAPFAVLVAFATISCTAPLPTSAQSAAAAPAASAAAPGAPCPALLRHTFNRLQDGTPQSLCQYRGQVILVVNTASRCGFTKQFDALEAMYARYRERGFVVIGFPSSDFNQELESDKEIAEFCRTTYGVRFPLFQKDVGGSLTVNPFYVELARATGQSPKWNFHKYVIDREGKVVGTWKSSVTPDSRELTGVVEKLLATKPSA